MKSCLFSSLKKIVSEVDDEAAVDDGALSEMAAEVEARKVKDNKSRKSFIVLSVV